MGMPRGSRWKRLAIFSDEVNSHNASLVGRVLRAHRIEIEWWSRPIRPTLSTADRPVYKSVEWLMVRRGDWPLAFVLAKYCGVTLATQVGLANGYGGAVATDQHKKTKRGKPVKQS